MATRPWHLQIHMHGYRHGSFSLPFEEDSGLPDQSLLSAPLGAEALAFPFCLSESDFFMLDFGLVMSLCCDGFRHVQETGVWAALLMRSGSLFRCPGCIGGWRLSRSVKHMPRARVD